VLEGTVDDVFCDRFFTGQHQNVHEFGDIGVAEFWIRQDLALGYFTTTWHVISFYLQLSALRSLAAAIIAIHLLGLATGSTQLM
jgi:hypothetical protein